MAVTDSEIAALAQLCVEFDVASKAIACFEKEREKLSGHVADLDSQLMEQRLCAEQARAEIQKYALAIVEALRKESRP